MRSITCISILIISLVVSAQSVPGKPRGDESRLHHRALMIAVREEDGLHKAAQLEGGTFTITTPYHPYVEPASLQDLAKESDIIIKGTILSNVCKLNPHGNSIRTDYIATIQAVLLGTVTDKDIIVSLPGGMFKFDDGLTVRQDVPHYRRIENDSTVVLFLRRDHENRNIPVAGPSGIFEIHGGLVRPFALRGSELVPKYNDSPETVFIDAIKTTGKEMGLHR